MLRSCLLTFHMPPGSSVYQTRSQEGRPMLVSCLREESYQAQMSFSSCPLSHLIPHRLSWPHQGAGGSLTDGCALPPILQVGKLTHMVRSTDFLEVVELVAGGLGPRAPLPGSQSYGLAKELPLRGDEGWASVQPLWQMTQ